MEDIEAARNLALRILDEGGQHIPHQPHVEHWGRNSLGASISGAMVVCCGGISMRCFRIRDDGATVVLLTNGPCATGAGTHEDSRGWGPPAYYVGLDLRQIR